MGIANIRIREQLESFGQTVLSDDELDTIIVKAPWHEEHFLKFPKNTSFSFGETISVRLEAFEPTPTVQFRLLRFRKEASGNVSGITPHKEGVLFQTDEVVFLVSSVPALEY